jgi:tRNA1(Val) A37 N6-methylase TrmN6
MPVSPMPSRRSDKRALDVPVTDDAFLGGKLKLLQPARGHRAGHDAMLLAAAAPSKIWHAVDLGAGSGAAGLALLARGAAQNVTLVEIDAQLCKVARENAARNGCKERVHVVRANIARVGKPDGPKEVEAGSAELVIMNPPFNDPARNRTSPDKARKMAHAAPDTDIDVWLQCATRLLRANGHVVLIHRPEAIVPIITAMEGRFGAAEIIPVHSRPKGPAIRLIVRAIKGRKASPAFRPGFVLADNKGGQTEAAEAILRKGFSLDEA